MDRIWDSKSWGLPLASVFSVSVPVDVSSDAGSMEILFSTHPVLVLWIVYNHWHGTSGWTGVSHHWHRPLCWLSQLWLSFSMLWSWILPSFVSSPWLILSWVGRSLRMKQHDEDASTKEFEKKKWGVMLSRCHCEVGKSQPERCGKFRLHGTFRTNQLKISFQAQVNPCFPAKKYSVSLRLPSPCIVG